MFNKFILLSVYIGSTIYFGVCENLEGDVDNYQIRTPNLEHDATPIQINYTSDLISGRKSTVKALNITTRMSKLNRIRRSHSIFERNSARISDSEKIERFLDHDNSSAKYVLRKNDEVKKHKGAVSKLGYFPAQTDIKDAATGKHKCSGTLVEDKHVLTTAHCVYKSSADQLAVIAGDTSLLPGHASTRESRRVELVVIHPDYFDSEEDGLQFNIAILRLDMPFSRSNYLHPAVIPQKSVANNTLCFIVGWALSEENNSFDLYYADVQTKDMEQCYRCVGHAICAGRHRVETCIGDEGGPLMCNGVLHGVYMTSANNCQALTGIYTDIVFYKHWVDRIIDWGGDSPIPVPMPYARKRTFTVMQSESDAGSERCENLWMKVLRQLLIALFSLFNLNMT